MPARKRISRRAIALAVGLSLLAGCVVALSPLGAAAIAAALLFAAACTAFPVFGFYVAAALVPILTANVTHNSPTTTVNNLYPLSYIPLTLAFAGWLLRRLARRESAPLPEAAVVAMPVLLAVWGAITLVWTLDINHGVCQEVSLVMAVFLFVLTQHAIRDEASLMRFLRFLIPVGVILGTFTLLSKEHEWRESYSLVNRWSLLLNLYHVAETLRGGGMSFRPAGFATPQAACNTLGFFILVTAAVYPTVRRGWRRMVLVGVMLYLLFGMLWTASKGGILGLILGTCFIFFMHPDMKRKRMLWSMGLVGAMVGLLLFNINVLGNVRLAGGGGSGDVAEASFSSRLGFWESGFTMMKSWWCGAGAGGLLAVLDPVPGAHSIYLSILFDLGLVGLVFFGVYLVELVLRLNRARREGANWQLGWAAYCMTGATILLLFHCLVDIDYSFLYFWLSTSLAYAVSRVAVAEHGATVTAGTDCPGRDGSPDRTRA